MTRLERLAFEFVQINELYRYHLGDNSTIMNIADVAGYEQLANEAYDRLAFYVKTCVEGSYEAE